MIRMGGKKMSNITFETSSFSEQLGIFDFFNVLVTGAVFIFGLGISNNNIGSLLFGDVNLLSGIGIILVVYVSGIVLQEIASFCDGKWMKIYSNMNRRMLSSQKEQPCGINGMEKEKCEKCETFCSKRLIRNPLTLQRYRALAEELLEDFSFDMDDAKFDKKCVNGFFFSVCQYYVSVSGKDKKVEKMRALYDSSKTLTICFGVLTTYMLFACLGKWDIFFEVQTVIGENAVVCRRIFLGTYLLLTMIFCYRTKQVMKRFLHILLGTYDAIKRKEEIELKKAEKN